MRGSASWDTVGVFPERRLCSPWLVLSLLPAHNMYDLLPQTPVQMHSARRNARVMVDLELEFQNCELHQPLYTTRLRSFVMVTLNWLARVAA